MANNQMQVHQQNVEPWRVTLIDTGDDTLTGGRLKRVADYIRDEKAFCFTHGDGVSDLDITGLVRFHKEHGNSPRSPRSRRRDVTVPWSVLAIG